MNRTRPPASARAFAMPVVLLLSIVASLAVAVMLQRQTVQNRLASREAAFYRAHHVGRGLVEVLGTWVGKLEPGAVAERLGDDGHALDIELETGERIGVWLREVQGSILTDIGGLTGASLQDAQGIIAAMEQIARQIGEVHEGWTRRHGPVAVSVNTAPEPVLLAVATFATGGDPATESFVRDLLRQRQRAALAEIEIIAAARDAGFSPEVQHRLRRLLTALPELWELRVDVFPARAESGPPQARYRALIQLHRSRPGRGTDIRALLPGGEFLSWEQVAPD